MAEGLTEADLAELLAPSSPKAGDDAVRADAIRAEIYQRHGIAPGRSPQEAIDRINMRAKLRKSVGGEDTEESAWGSPEARAQARIQYALADGTDQRVVDRRLDESMHLLDPRTYQYMQRFGRDLDFLDAYGKNKSAMDIRASQPPLEEDPTGMSAWGLIRAFDQQETDSRLKQAVHYYDASKEQPLARTGVYGNPLARGDGYGRFQTWQNAMMTAVADPETGTGGYMTWAEVPAQAILTSARGETGHKPVDIGETGPLSFVLTPILRGLMDREAWDRARAVHNADIHYRPNAPSPVADFDEKSKPSADEIRARVAELRQKQASAMPPMQSEGWYRTTGYAPPGWITDPIDFAVRAIDPSAVIPVAGAAGALAKGGKAAAGPVLKGFAKDMLHEQALNSGMGAAFGGEPGRSPKQFLFGGGQPGVDFQYKTPEELEQARQDARELGAELNDNDRVSRAQEQMYDEVRKRSPSTTYR